MRHSKPLSDALKHLLCVSVSSYTAQSLEWCRKLLQTSRPLLQWILPWIKDSSLNPLDYFPCPCILWLLLQYAYWSFSLFLPLIYSINKTHFWVINLQAALWGVSSKADASLLPSVELLSPVSHNWNTYGLRHISFKHGDTGRDTTQGGKLVGGRTWWILWATLAPSHSTAFIFFAVSELSGGLYKNH